MFDFAQHLSCLCKLPAFSSGSLEFPVSDGRPLPLQFSPFLINKTSELKSTREQTVMVGLQWLQSIAGRINVLDVTGCSICAQVKKYSILYRTIC
jgi:hypothetical protein